jgi:hypothetical protein
MGKNGDVLFYLSVANDQYEYELGMKVLTYRVTAKQLVKC